jgi:hypothetical protein
MDWIDLAEPYGKRDYKILYQDFIHGINNHKKKSSNNKKTHTTKRQTKLFFITIKCTANALF